MGAYTGVGCTAFRGLCYVLSHSPYKEIWKLESGMCLILQDGRLSTKTYWRPGEVADLRLKSLDEYAEMLLELLQVNSKEPGTLL